MPKPEGRKKPEHRNPKSEPGHPGSARTWFACRPLRGDCKTCSCSAETRRPGLRLRFVLPKLHAKWLQYFVARNVFLDFLWAYFSAARPHIYKHLRKQEHWHCGTRRPRVSRNCDSGRWRSFVSFWFWLCQFRISISLFHQESE